MESELREASATLTLAEGRADDLAERLGGLGSASHALQVHLKVEACPYTSTLSYATATTLLLQHHFHHCAHVFFCVHTWILCGNIFAADIRKAAFAFSVGRAVKHPVQTTAGVERREYYAFSRISIDFKEKEQIDRRDDRPTNKHFLACAPNDHNHPSLLASKPPHDKRKRMKPFSRWKPRRRRCSLQQTRARLVWLKLNSRCARCERS